MTMVHNVESILHEDNKLNPTARLWQKVSMPTIFNHKLFEYMKLAKIAIIQVLSSIEDKCTFQKNCFTNNKLWNRLKIHLDPCNKFYNQRDLNFKFFLMKRSLPNSKASSIIVWMHRSIIVANSLKV
jgi:hypothetical protein